MGMTVLYILCISTYIIYIPTNVHVHVNHVQCFTTYKHCACTQKQSISLPQEVTFVTSSLCATHQASGTREGSHGLKEITLVKYRYFWQQNNYKHVYVHTWLTHHGDD